MIRVDTFVVIRKDESLWLAEIINQQETLEQEKTRLMLRVNNNLPTLQHKQNPYMRCTFLKSDKYKDLHAASPITIEPKPYHG